MYSSASTIPKIDIRPASIGDAEFVGNRLRRADRIEAAALGVIPLPGTIGSFRQSVKSWTGFESGEATMVFGVAPNRDGTGCPWLVATDRMRELREFSRLSARYVAEMREVFPTLRNIVYHRNRASIRWLQWLGFKMGKPEPRGPKGELFLTFQIG